MDLISRLLLLSGMDLELAPGVTVRHPTVSDVLGINHGLLCEDHYWTYVFSVLSDPYDNMVYLDDNGIDYENATPFDVLMLRWSDARKDATLNRDKYRSLGFSPLTMLRDAMSFFFGSRHFEFASIGGQIALVDLDDPGWILTKEAFALAATFIAKCNCIVRTDQIKPGSPSAKQILLEDKRAEEKRRARKKAKEAGAERIAEALATVFAGGAGTITPDNYPNIHVYQLLSTAHSVQKQMVVQSMFNGIYTGMMKADKLPDKELRWV